MEFLEYRITSDILCMGERIKKGTFRPCITTIPYSQITGALKAILGREIAATGCLIRDGIHNNVEYLIYSPRDRSTETSKLPLTIQILTNVLGRVFIPKNDSSELPEQLSITMGALKSKGIGRCKLKKIRKIKNPRFKRGMLNTRIPLDLKENFGIRNVIKPQYGYLFRPTSSTSGVYVLSLFENSEIYGPEFLMR